MQLRGAEGGPDGDSLGQSHSKGPRLYDDPYEEPITSAIPPVTRNISLAEATDMRPKEDYDEPWEWSKQSLLLQSQLESAGTNVIPPHFRLATGASQNRTPQLKRTAAGPASGSKDTEGSEGTDSGDGGSAGSPMIAEAPAAEPEVVDADADDTYEATSGYEQTQRTKAPGEPDSDDDGYTPLREEFGPSGPKPPDTDTTRTGNYEEPWDLTSKQKELEDKIKAASVCVPREKAKTTGPAPHESDTRSQEGYEKPWDWKPHLKDDRPQEGYEKPWDWKPHQKDDRPPEEYEEPWDQKAKELERDLMLGKGSGPPSGTTSPTTASSANATTTAVTTTPAQAVKDNKEDDTRPPAEYDEPWDKKKAPASRTGKISITGQTRIILLSNVIKVTKNFGQARIKIEFPFWIEQRIMLRFPNVESIFDLNCIEFSFLLLYFLY